MKAIIISLALFASIICQEWDYKKHGKDWESEFRFCKSTQKSPIIIRKEISSLFETGHFFPKMNKNVIGKLQHENYKNHLVLNFTEKDNDMGEIGVWPDDFYGEGYISRCQGISFKFPSEHLLTSTEGEEPKRFDMELQVNCTGKDGDQIISTTVIVLVKITEEGEKQSLFFDNLKVLEDEKIDKTKLPYDVKIKSFDDLMDGFSMLDGVYTYNAYINMPPCEQNTNYVYIDNPLKINKSLFDQLKSCLSDNVPEEGNYREASELITSASTLFALPKFEMQ